MALILKPNCEYCDRDLPPDSEEACICSYECTFCRECVDNILRNVCPNCGGGFQARPVRPVKARRQGVSLEHQPASDKRVHLSHSHENIAQFVEQVKDIAPHNR